MIFRAASSIHRLLVETYHSLGGGFARGQLGCLTSHHITCKSLFSNVSWTLQDLVEGTANLYSYLYGGLGFGCNSSGFDDVYILSVPPFQWVQLWESSNGGVPHHSLTCNVVTGQMLIIGGTFPLTDNCDSPPTWGTHNLDLGKTSGKMWNPYYLSITSHSVPPEVVTVVGGS